MDWPIESSSTSQLAFANAIANTYYANNTFGSLPLLTKVQPLATVMTSPTPTPTPAGTPTPTPSPTPQPTSSTSPLPSPLASDTTAPIVSIASPANGAVVSRNSNFTIQANATDNVAVAKVEIYVDGGLKCTDINTPYSCITKISGKPKAAYTISAKAYDTSGNTSSSSVTVTTK